MLIIGPVVTLRDELAWYEKRPLFAQRIVVTRPREQGLPASARLEAMGAEVLLAPTVEIGPLANNAPLDAAIDRLSDYDWLVFTSANGVRFFVERLAERGRDLRALGHLKLAAIGPTTAHALAQIHLRADVIPESYRSESLAEALGRIAPTRKFCWPGPIGDGQSSRRNCKSWLMSTRCPCTATKTWNHCRRW